ncbi:MAG TPA: hypothetical protein VH879_05395 [Gemmatimonadales bacterium]|jgi:hypothetical protein
MHSISHRGFRITARPYQLLATGHWTIDIEISRKGHLRTFSSDDRYLNEQEAIAQSFAFARRIIAGEISGCSVASLHQG